MRRDPMTKGILPDSFSHDADNGKIYDSGKAVGRLSQGGYIRLDYNYHSYLGHRVAWFLHYGEWPEGQVDHINGIRDDNRICNLRCVTNIENSRNAGVRKANTSGYVGVGVHKATGTWQAYINIDGVRKNLGIFRCVTSAAIAREKASIAAGYHPNHGKRLCHG